MALAVTALGAPKAVITMIPFLFDSTSVMSGVEATDAIDWVHLLVTTLNVIVVPLLGFVAYRWRKTLEHVWAAIRLYMHAKTLESDKGRTVTADEMRAVLDEIEQAVKQIFANKDKE